MARNQVKACTRKVWNDYEVQTCKGLVTDGAVSKCTNSENHILKFKTGFCLMGLCEGTKPHSSSGKPMTTCKFAFTCPCKCHADIWLMAKMTETERQVIDNPEKVHEPRAYWMPSDDPDWQTDILSIPTATDAPAIIESPAPDLVPASAAVSYAPTATGRAARGELESWVKRFCDVWLIEGYDFACSPAWLADEIAKDRAIDPPSVGAISAVFERWTSLEFAVIEKKPTRFMKYTDEGIRLGLARMKEDAKRKSKREQAEKHRNLIR